MKRSDFRKLLALFDSPAQAVIDDAVAKATAAENQPIGTEFLLLSISEQAGSLGAAILTQSGITPHKISETATKLFARLPGKPTRDVSLTPRFIQVADKAHQLAQQKHRKAGTGELLAALMAVTECMGFAIIVNITGNGTYEFKLLQERIKKGLFLDDLEPL